MAESTIVLTQKVKELPENIDLTLPLTADQRQKARQRIELENGDVIHFQLPRGSHIHAKNYFQTESGDVTVQVIAEAESVVTVRSTEPLALLKAAYHLGNRHVPLEVKAEYLRFAPDHVLEEMLGNLPVDLTQETAPFFPEHGAYGHHH